MDYSSDRPTSHNSESSSGGSDSVGGARHTFPAPAYAPDRWKNVKRSYDVADVEKLRGSMQIRHTLAEHGAHRLWELLNARDYVNTLGAFTGNQALQHVRAGLEAIYLSGWQVAADANNAGQMYPDQSLYPVSSVPDVVQRINAAFQRADGIQSLEQAEGTFQGDAVSWFAPIIADAEAGFGGALNAFELMKAMIVAGAAGVHFEDQLAAEKKCGHLGGKVLVPTATHIRTLNAARLAADVCDVPTLVIARTDAESARLITSDIDPADHRFLTGERTSEGFYRITGGVEMGIARGIAYAEYADLVWMETPTPDLKVAKRFAEEVKAAHPEQMLAYNCSPSFNWRKHLDESDMKKFQRELGAMGYKFQFVTLAGFHSLNLATFELASAYKRDGMAGYSALQEREFRAQEQGFSAVRHQREVGVGYFDAVANAVAGGSAATAALAESTEAAQF